jgi:hypothetical protein
MRRLGAKGGSVGKGNAQRRGAIEKTPELRSVLRTMDPHIVKAGLEEILVGNNAGAKVSAVKLLADLELYRQGDRDSRENELKLQIKTAAEEFDRKFAYRLERMDAIRRKQLLEILEPIGLGELVDLDDGQLVRELARRLAAIPAAVREEHVAP